MNSYKISHGIILGVLLWIVALIYATIIMMVLGVDFSTPFGIDSPQYWTFELIMIPSFFVFSSLVLILYFRRSKRFDGSLMLGMIIMGVQFVLDTIVLVYLLGNGFSYFVGLVTISYLIIPLLTKLIGTWVESKSV